MEYQQRLHAQQSLVEDYLSTCFRDCEARTDLYQAMEYSLLAGGKRLRPVLVLESCRLCGGNPQLALPFACGLEMIHTYSLIHDDLPCMDDDDLRRGKPTNHKVYGEAMAVLAGDALLTAAFETALTKSVDVPAERVLKAAACLAKAAGASGMVGGQALDMAAEGHGVIESDLRQIQALKTGALIQAAVELGCILAGGTAQQQRAVATYAQKLGLAFQVQDDLLDVIGQEDQLGKTIGSDSSNDKTTFYTLKGKQGCKDLVDSLTSQAIEALQDFQEPAFLSWLAALLSGRQS